MFDTHAALTEVLAGFNDFSIEYDHGKVQRLAESGDRTLVPRVQAGLERSLDEENFFGVEVLAQVLAGILGPRAFPLLLRAIARPIHHDWDGLSATLADLMGADPVGCRATAVSFATERHTDLRRAGLWALGYVVTPEDFDLLEAALRDPDVEVRGDALGAMSSLRDDPRALAAMRGVLQDPAPWMRDLAARILAGPTAP
ncbi:HEAT repeat domain-containing protein [Dactylosporangium cerinum]|uniref:HEAT repeat domain-containing protein n=1 Tax=Dactylosporangium cerinum TaxID=1434730 RepID=A0ABV9VZ15_9ACTN